MRPGQKSSSVYVFDTLITKANERTNHDPETIKILVCKTQGKDPEIIEKLMKGIKAQDNAPIIYIFSEVNLAMSEKISSCLPGKSYYIFKQPYPKSENRSENAQLVTLFKKSEMCRHPPEEIEVKLGAQPVQSFLCELSYSATGLEGSWFVLHTAHLNLDNTSSISEVEASILEKIFNRPNQNKKYPQILAGDLGIPTMAGDSWSQSIAALTYFPLSADVNIKLARKSYWNVNVAPFQLIDPATAQPYAKLTDMWSYGMDDISQLTLLSRFGEKYLEVCDGMLGHYTEESEDASSLEDKINYHILAHLKYIDYKKYEEYLISVRLACMPRDYPIRYHLVLKIPKKLWLKLGAFIDTTDMVVKEEQDDCLLSGAPYDRNQLILSVKKAVEALAEYSFFKLESSIPGLRVELFKQPSNSIGFRFVTEPVNKQVSSIATQIAADKTLHTIDANTEDLLENLMSVVTQISTVNAKFSGLVTASFLYQQQAKGSPYFIKIKFFNPAIARFVCSSGKPTSSGNAYIVKPLDKHSYYKSRFLQQDGSLTLPINACSTKNKLSDRETYLVLILSYRAEAISKYLPFVINAGDEGTLTAQNALPYALLQRFSLGKPMKAGHLFSYPAEKGYADIAGGLFQDYFNLASVLVAKLKNYTGTDQAYQELAAVSKAKGDDVLAACQNMVVHCSEKTTLAEGGSGIFGLFNTVEIDKHTDLLHRSIAKVKANFVFNCKADSNIQTLQQLINTQEKRALVELCEKERKSADGEPYKKIRKNSALLLLENHLILSHPEYTANDVWEHIKRKPVRYRGTGKNYPYESSGGKLTLGEILKPVTEIWNALSLLVTSNDVTTHAKEKLSK